MKTLTLQSEVGGDGKLRLEIRCDLPPGPVEVVVVVQSTALAPAVPGARPVRSARSGLFVGKAPPSLDLDTISDEITGLWNAKLADLEP